MVIDSNFDKIIYTDENVMRNKHLSNRLFDLKLDLLRQEIIIAQIKYDSIKYEAHYFFDSIQFNPFHHDYLVWE